MTTPERPGFESDSERPSQAGRSSLPARGRDGTIPASRNTDSLVAHPAKHPRILLLAGTSEARALAARLAQEGYDAVASLAGRTSAPAPLALPTRVGGFGGVEGLARYLADNRITHVVDATHPFAAQISANAGAACAALGLPLVAFGRAPWRPEPDDRWIEVADNAAAAAALGSAPRRVFLTIGRQGVADFRAAPHHDYVLRVIDAPDPDDLPPNCALIYARGQFAREDEIALMRARRIDVVVSKNSGGALTYAKIEAARALGLPVVMIAPPPRAGVAVAHDVDAVMAFLTS